jgi:hypothetical protein
LKELGTAEKGEGAGIYCQVFNMAKKSSKFDLRPGRVHFLIALADSRSGLRNKECST